MQNTENILGHKSWSTFTIKGCCKLLANSQSPAWWRLLLALSLSFRGHELQTGNIARQMQSISLQKLVILIQMHLSGFRVLHLKASISICLSVFFPCLPYNYFSAVLSTNQRGRKALQFQSCFLSFSKPVADLVCLPTHRSPACLWLNRDLHRDPLKIFKDEHIHKDSASK